MVKHAPVVVTILCATLLGLSGIANGQKVNDQANSSRVLFEKLKGLTGSWIGQSTKGWTDTVSFKVVAGGSVVVEESFGAHPNETMYTMYYMDGDCLMLTHYCVARNQPRLIASEFTDSDNTVTFTFLDATGISSRDKGHMDKCQMSFLDDDQFSSRWTWYQDGKESWMEEILHQRVR